MSYVIGNHGIARSTRDQAACSTRSLLTFVRAVTPGSGPARVSWGQVAVISVGIGIPIWLAMGV